MQQNGNYTDGNNRQSNASKNVGNFIAHEMVESHEWNASFHARCGVHLEGLTAGVAFVPEEHLNNGARNSQPCTEYFLYVFL
jgi:hypothetical protein